MSIRVNKAKKLMKGFQYLRGSSATSNTGNNYSDQSKLSRSSTKQDLLQQSDEEQDLEEQDAQHDSLEYLNENAMTFFSSSIMMMVYNSEDYTPKKEGCSYLQDVPKYMIGLIYLDTEKLPTMKQFLLLKDSSSSQIYWYTLYQKDFIGPIGG
ncbi:hypothetical protein BDA99DRAFT_534608 [Phascolomyces articulosus]|uniref:Uncharacterized protein n=1 Tax=Phascolomyces articulosus TaxID=60185 RepID=A0AAD5KLC5_9FUNG|nr:hypothetical protein BDA99DRAFT_534608 [Phascolomyces articulosus]